MAPLDATFVLLVALLLVVTLLGNTFVSAQEDDFSSPIKCYDCEGPAEESDCADPIDTDTMNTSYKLCEHGICLKWTKYKDKVLQMVRTCSADVNFHLTMIDGVCRTERNGNGYLCMCGKNLCNSSPGSIHRESRILLPIAFLIGILASSFHWVLSTALESGFTKVFPILRLLR